MMFDVDDSGIMLDCREPILSESIPPIVFHEFIKCVVVGDSGVGKTCLITSWASNARYKLEQLVKTHVSTVWAHDHYRNDPEILAQSVVAIDGGYLALRLWDTFGYHDKGRGFAYKGADIVLLCYSVAMPRSLANLKKIWIPEIRRKAPSTPIMVVGCQADLRYLYRDEKYQKVNKGLMYKVVEEKDIVTPDQGRSIAREIGAPYYECSVFARYGIQDVFLNAIRLAMVTKKRFRFWDSFVRRIQYPLIQAPMKLPLVLLPTINVPKPEVLHHNWSELLENQMFTDVVFVVHGQCIRAHKICLAASSAVFENFFIDSQCCITDSVTSSSSPVALSDSDNCCHSAHDCNIPFHAAFLTSEEKECESSFRPDLVTRQTFVTLRNEITPKAFSIVLRYLYTGKVPEDCDSCDDVLLASKLLHETNLFKMLCNSQSTQCYMNTELEKMFVERTRKKLQELALKKEKFSDVRFLVDDGTVRAHKALLIVRCEMMRAMFANDFIESAASSVKLPGVSRDVLLAVIEFLYMNECPTNAMLNSLGIIEAANRMCLPRLVKLVEAKVVEELTEADDNGDDILEDVFKLLEQTQLHNADQLTVWCRQFLCNHFQLIKQKYMKLFNKLSPDDIKFIEKNRWPPEWYIKELSYYDGMQETTVKSKKSEVRSLCRNQLLPNQKQYISLTGCLCFNAKRKKGRPIIDNFENIEAPA